MGGAGGADDTGGKSGAGGAGGAGGVIGVAGIPIDGIGLGILGTDPKGDGDVGVGLGLTDVGLVAASIAFILPSLSSFPANIIPERIPVKKVEIGINSSKNF